MKKTLIIALSLMLIVMMAFGLSSCKDEEEPTVTYSIDSAEFETVVKFGDELDLSGLHLVSDAGDRIPVTADMVGGADTGSIGAKTLTISYEEQTFTVDYTVKFLVKFIVNGVETSYLVENVSELTLPETPNVVGKQFEGWSRELPNVLTSNLVIEAIYKNLSNAREDVFTWLGEGVIDITGYAPADAEYEVVVLDEDGEEDSSLADVEIDAASNKITYTLAGNDPVIIALKAFSDSQLVVDKSWYVEKVSKPTISVGTGDVIGILLGERITTERINVASDITFKYQVIPANNNISAYETAEMLFIDVLKAGVTDVTIKATNAMNALETIEINTCVVVMPNVFDIVGIQKGSGDIEGIWTVGRESFGGTIPAISTYYTNAGDGFVENLTWVTSDPDVTVVNGVITMADGTSKSAEIVEVKARFSYGGVVCDSTPVNIRCVFDGVNVFDYNGLYQESIKTSPRPVILQNSIVDDFSSTNHVVMDTTYDAGYYTNKRLDAKIKVLLQLKNDVYGNGYEINAHNATLGTHDKSGAPVYGTSLFFGGPLSFVAFSQESVNVEGAISVKGQDNICFAVYEGVTLNNITLKSCNLTPDPDTGKLDLTDLDYAGTTVEVLGDDVVIEYSRINNGRTVVRVFGDVNDASKEIELTIKNSILGYAREFILRMGSNCFVKCEEELPATRADGQDELSHFSPLLPGDTGVEYNKMKNGEYAKMSDDEKAAYDAKFIKTYVTVENSVFEEAGIFAIGIDSHFAGQLLHDAALFKAFSTIPGFEVWKDLAKTSYGAKLTFEGDVRMYNWKKLDDIDSSTLITNGIGNVQGFGNNTDMVKNLQFNVSSMIHDIATYDDDEKAKGEKWDPSFQNVMDTIDGVNYIHNGIGFFGGGKNYGVFENNVESVSFNHEFEIYKITFADVEQAFLSIAAGNEPFFFVLYDAAGSFKYTHQQNLANKYEVVYK